MNRVKKTKCAQRKKEKRKLLPQIFYHSVQTHRWVPFHHRKAMKVHCHNLFYEEFVGKCVLYQAVFRKFRIENSRNKEQLYKNTLHMQTIATAYKDGVI